MTDAQLSKETKLSRAARDLAILAMQSERYAQDGEFRDAVDDVLAITRPREVWIPEAAFPNELVYAYTGGPDKVPRGIQYQPTGRILKFREVCDE